MLMHWLVYATDTLVVAMAAHTLYDWIAGSLIARRAARYDVKDANFIVR